MNCQVEIDQGPVESAFAPPSIAAIGKSWRAFLIKLYRLIEVLNRAIEIISTRQHGAPAAIAHRVSRIERYRMLEIGKRLIVLPLAEIAGATAVISDSKIVALDAAGLDSPVPRGDAVVDCNLWGVTIEIIRMAGAGRNYQQHEAADGKVKEAGANFAKATMAFTRSARGVRAFSASYSDLRLRSPSHGRCRSRAEN